jgi:outer membrane biosynthesis protein TonB
MYSRKIAKFVLVIVSVSTLLITILNTSSSATVSALEVLIPDSRSILKSESILRASPTDIDSESPLKSLYVAPPVLAPEPEPEPEPAPKPEPESSIKTESTPKDESALEPSTEPITESTAEPVSVPVIQPASEPETETELEPASEQISTPVPAKSNNNKNSSSNTTKSSSNKTSSKKSSSSSDSSNNSGSQVSTIPKDPNASVKLMLESKIDVLRERISTVNGKWVLRAISDTKVDYAKKEIQIKVSFKYMEDDWTSFRANAYINLEMLSDDINSSTPIRFKTIDKIVILDPTVDMSDVLSDFEQKTNKALNEQQF